MNKKAVINILGIAIISLILLALYLVLIQTTQPSQLILRFKAAVDNKPLVLHHKSYANPGGDGLFTVRDLQFFISNIKLLGQAGNVSETESYHLVRFDNDNNFYEIVLPNINAHDYQQIELGIGVDPKANGTITIAGDLDPNGRMAWSWDVGYKFLLLEGTLINQEQQVPLVYHIGFNSSYTRLSFPIKEAIKSNNTLINFNVELLHLFNKSKPIDLAEISTVKFDKKDVAVIAQGFKSLITLE